MGCDKQSNFFSAPLRLRRGVTRREQTTFGIRTMLIRRGATRLRGFVLGFIEAFAAEAKHAVGSRPVVLPGDSSSQFDQLRSGKPLLQPLAELRRDSRRRNRECVSQFEHQLLVAVEQIAFRIPVQVADLIVADSDCSAAETRLVLSSARLNFVYGISTSGCVASVSSGAISFFSRLRANRRMRATLSPESMIIT